MTEHTSRQWVYESVKQNQQWPVQREWGPGLGQACWPGVRGRDLRGDAWHRPKGHTPQKREKKEATFRHMVEQTQCPSGRSGRNV